MGLRLREIRKRAGYKTQTDAAEAFGVSKTRWNNWENEKNGIPMDLAGKLCAFLGCTYDELMDGSVQESRTVKPLQSVHIPLIGIVAAGSAKEAIEQTDVFYPVPKGMYGDEKDLVGLKNSGNSRNRIFADGTILIVNRAAEIRDKDIAVIFVNGDDVTVKRVFLDDDEIILHPESYDPESRDRVIKKTDPEAPEVRFFGKVVGFGSPIDWRP